jgi:hypothetical protein
MGNCLVHRTHERRPRPDRAEDALRDRPLDLTDPSSRSRELVEAEHRQSPEFGVAHESMPLESYLGLAEELGLTIVPSFPQLPGEDTWVLADGRYIGDFLPFGSDADRASFAALSDEFGARRPRYLRLISTCTGSFLPWAEGAQGGIVASASISFSLEGAT